MSSLPPLAALRVFEAAARHENFSRAAEELALTQAGVSYQVKLLEERLNARLFVRKGRGMALTDLGQRIAPRVSEAFALLGDAFASVRSANESVLSISANITFGTNWLAGRIGSFQIERPSFAVRLDVANRLADLEADEADVAIRYATNPGPGLVAHFLMRQAVTPMASPAFLAKHKVSEPRDLLHVPRLSQIDDWWTLWFELVDGGTQDLARPTGMGFDTQVLDGNAAIAGQGVAVLNPVFFAREIEAGLLVQQFPWLAIEQASFWLVYPEHKRRMAKVQAFRHWLLATIRESLTGNPHGLLEPPSSP
jgi:LysR family transcriptional regulator, glycine cleavage system transcriptional activator